MAGILPIAIVRPSIVESSERSPFSGWNEGINTSGPLSYLLGTNFRQLPTNARKCLDVIPVDMVCRGMSLIAAAVIARKNARMYQLATSAVNPVNMGRSIELTGLAHRKHYRMEQSIDNWLKVKFETIPVSKQRYERMSIPMQKAVISRINRVASALNMKKPPLAKAERDLEPRRKVDRAVRALHPAQRSRFRVREHPDAVRRPAARKKSISSTSLPKPSTGGTTGSTCTSRRLRRWCYPLMEGRPLESRTPRELGLDALSPRALRYPVPPLPPTRCGGPPSLWRFS